jgi:hypothetical protein
MKYTPFAIKFLIFLLCTNNLIFAQNTSKKHALIIAIGKYRSESYSEISSIRDLPLIKNALKNQGFPDKNIKVLTNKSATKKGILSSFNNLLLDTSVKVGDIVYIHFSSHGVQIMDENGDESDGLDEAIVPYEAIFSQPEYEKVKSAYLRDDDLEKFILKLRNKLGPNGDLLITMDNCFSGTGTKGEVNKIKKQRGNSAPLVPNGWERNAPNKKMIKEYLFKENIVNDIKENNLAPFVAISATQPDQPDVEIQDPRYKYSEDSTLGPLSYAFSKALNDVDTSITYMGLFSKIKLVMHGLLQEGEDQQPDIIGNGLNKKLFGGDVTAQKPFFEAIKYANNILTIKGGIFSGLNTGGIVELYPIGTNDPKLFSNKKITSARIIKCDLYSSQVLIDSKLIDDRLNSLEVWAFPTNDVYHIKPINLSLLSSNSSKYTSKQYYTDIEVKKIKDSLKKNALVQFDGPQENLLMVKGDVSDSIFIINEGKYFYRTVKYSSTGNIKELENVINDFVKYESLKREIRNDNIDFDLKLVPIRNGKPDTSLYNKMKSMGNISFKGDLKDTAVIWISNNNPFPVYFNVIDLAPNGEISPVLPSKYTSASELKVEANTSQYWHQEFFKIPFSPPYGNAIFKVFVSKEVIDMPYLLFGKSKGTGDNLILKGLSKSINDMNDLQETDSIDTSDGKAFNVNYSIVE